MRGGQRYLIQCDGVGIQVTHKLVKHLRINISRRDGSVTVTAPVYVDRAVVEAFVASKKVWMARHLAEIRHWLASAAPEEPRWENGARIPLWGREYRLTIEDARRRDDQGLDIREDVLILRVPLHSDRRQRARIFHKYAWALLLERMRDLAAYWSPRMGVPQPSLRVRPMTSRWGSCTPTTGVVRINTALVHMEPEFLEYVMVHELAHLRELGHTPQFWAIVEAQLPSWKTIRERMRRYPPRTL